MTYMAASVFIAPKASFSIRRTFVFLLLSLLGSCDGYSILYISRNIEVTNDQRCTGQGKDL